MGSAAEVCSGLVLRFVVSRIVGFGAERARLGAVHGERRVGGGMLGERR